MIYTFGIPAEYGNCYTRNTGPSAFPVFRVPIQLYDHNQGAFVPNPVFFLWDSAASFLTISREMANQYHIRFDEELDRVKDGFDGLGGNCEAWLTTTPIQFPRLATARRFLTYTRPRTAQFRFDFTVIIVDGLTVPLLGSSDMLRNFTITSTWDGTLFELNADHLGTPA